MYEADPMLNQSRTLPLWRPLDALGPNSDHYQEPALTGYLSSPHSITEIEGKDVLYERARGDLVPEVFVFFSNQTEPRSSEKKKRFSC